MLLNCVSTEQPVTALSRKPDWPEIFIGETVTLRRTIQGGRVSDWEYSWWKYNDNIKSYSEKREYVIGPSENYPSGQYKCAGRRKHDQQLAGFSNLITMTFKGMALMILFCSLFIQWSLSCPSPNSCKLPFFAGVSPFLQVFQSDLGGFYAQI